MTATLVAPAPAPALARPAGPRRRRLVVALSVAWLVFAVLNAVLSGRWWPWLLPDLLPPLVFALVPAAVTACVAALRLGRRQLLVALVGLVVGGAQAGLNPAALLPAPGRGAGTPLTVVSWNAEVWDAWDDPARFLAFLRAQDADVYLLQEYEEHGLRPGDFPGYTAIERGELLTLTRLPVRQVVALPAEPAAGSTWRQVYEQVKSLRVDVTAGEETVSLYNVHMPIPLDLVNPLSARFRQQLRLRFDARQRQYTALERDVRGNRHPVVVAGDFNTSPAMGDLRRFSGLNDAADANRSLYPASWRSYWPVDLWRLDWAFTSDQVTVRRDEFVDPLGMSDHDLQRIELTVRGAR
ncbi:endonuclease/exonuclease/phosphatase family protein [Dactylosporangium aurantiacum]|uniref:Endonuclease/exonuclease/phosphatase family protein n=1 Tax=Dactylosporangium aurantiacum TaxID=35754 RepID=A0A9Q9MGE9_9ACTN|nr:endonuclease/exonuclease/phosphatase family protein [Dactylosporangium aurantiacum]MDG6106279.1 endonuclease/exonuclease/phosphatase family protein [Dactylosporangium aurantiacum]UWZ58223.1 endonuclease/exonuclease/phosphatase family protein [Dactylosporangium aurantiacum]